MKLILEAFGKLVCGVTRSHRWNYRKYAAMSERVCNRCGVVKKVKRKAKVK